MRFWRKRKNNKNMKAIVIGSGIGGLATGIALRQIGYEVEIYERVAELKEVGAGITLWVNAIKAARKLGFGDELARMSLAEIGGGIYDHNGKPISLISQEALYNRYGDKNVAVHRAELQRLMLGKLGGETTLKLNHQLSHFEQAAKKVRAYFSNGHVAEGDLLIGADGIHSAVRQQLYPKIKPLYAGYAAHRGVTQFDLNRIQKVAGEHWGFGKRFGVVPLADNRVYWFTVSTISGKAINPQEPQKEKLLANFKGWVEPLEEIIAATAEKAILFNGIYDINPPKNWAVGKVALLGDAAHATTPNLGQGGCMAIEDAVELADCLQHNMNVQTALIQYVRRRANRTSRVVRQSRFIGNIGNIENELLGKLRNTAMRLVGGKNSLKQLDWLLQYEA
jgi:FAD-dependent urate hydroxylase